MPSDEKKKWQAIQDKMNELQFAFKLLEAAGGEPPSSNYHFDEAHKDLVYKLGLKQVERAQRGE